MVDYNGHCSDGADIIEYKLKTFVNYSCTVIVLVFDRNIY